MYHIYPNCNQYGIKPVAKFLASPAFPAICVFCGKASAFQQGTKLFTVMGAGALLMVLCFAAYAFIYPTLIFMYMSVVAVPTILLGTYYFVPLVPVDKKTIGSAKVIFLISALLFAAYFIYSVASID